MTGGGWRVAGEQKKTAFVPLTYNVMLMFSDSDFCHLFFPISSEVLLSAFRFNITLMFFYFYFFVFSLFPGDITDI